MGIVMTAMIVLTALVPVAVLRAQETPDAAPARPAAPAAPSMPTAPAAPAAPAPAPVGLSIEEQMRIRRDQERVPAPPAWQVTPTVREGPSANLDATIYDVRIPADQIGRLDLESLSRNAASAADFEKAIAALGKVKPLYRANQSVRLGGDTVSVGSSTPYVTNSRTLNSGQVVNSVSYADTGATVNLAGRTVEGGQMELDLRVDVSALLETTTEIAPNVKASIFRRASMSHKGLVKPSQPFVVVSVDAASVDLEGNAVAYVARVSVSAPQGVTAPVKETTEVRTPAPRAPGQ
jgi:hypothetical protein